jgi:hypothetical protein
MSLSIFFFLCVRNNTALLCVLVVTALPFLLFSLLLHLPVLIVWVFDRGGVVFSPSKGMRFLCTMRLYLDTVCMCVIYIHLEPNILSLCLVFTFLCRGAYFLFFFFFCGWWDVGV